MSTKTTEADNSVAVTLDNYTEADSDHEPSEILEEIDVFSHSKDELAELLPCSCIEGDLLPCFCCVLAGRKALLEDSEGERTDVRS